MRGSHRTQALRRWLLAHRPADAHEKTHLQHMLDLLRASCGDPFSRTHFDPGHFTASAFVLSPRGDSLLLIQHKKLGRWLQPGGHVESGDRDLLAAARREALEETGLGALMARHEGPFDLDVHRIPALGTEPQHLHYDVRFLFRAESTDALAKTPEVGGARFVPLTELVQQSAGSDHDHSVRRAARKLLPPTTDESR